MSKKVEVELYDCNYSFGGIVHIECREFKQLDKYSITADNVKIRFGFDIKEVEITEE